jgi:hypothetical protein
METRLSLAASTGTNIIYAHGLGGDLDPAFIERFWKDSGFFLQATDQPKIFKFHRINKEEV